MVLEHLFTKTGITHSYGNQMRRFKWLRDHYSELYYSYQDTKTQKQLERSQNSQNRRFVMDFQDSLLVFHYFEHNSLI